MPGPPYQPRRTSKSTGQYKQRTNGKEPYLLERRAGREREEQELHVREAVVAGAQRGDPRLERVSCGREGLFTPSGDELVLKRRAARFMSRVPVRRAQCTHSAPRSPTKVSRPTGVGCFWRSASNQLDRMPAAAGFDVSLSMSVNRWAGALLNTSAAAALEISTSVSRPAGTLPNMSSKLDSMSVSVSRCEGVLGFWRGGKGQDAGQRVTARGSAVALRCDCERVAQHVGLRHQVRVSGVTRGIRCHPALEEVLVLTSWDP
jgi:hypothetical protein